MSFGDLLLEIAHYPLPASNETWLNFYRQFISMIYENSISVYLMVQEKCKTKIN